VTIAAQRAIAGNRTWNDRVDFWRQELGPTPGRLNGVLRIVVATALVLTTSMTLEVPTIALSLFVVLFLTKATSAVTTQNSVAAMIIGLIAVVVVTFAIALTILILDATIDHPPLRLAAMALVFFLGMYASRVFKVGPAGFLVAIIVLVSQAYVDLFPGPEPIVRAVLWVWVAVVYPAGVAVGVNLVLLPADPEPVLRREVVARLRSVARGLAPQRDSDEAQDVAKELTAFSAQGTTPLTRLMRLAELRDSSLAPMRVERMAKIHLLMRLVDSAALLADTPVRRSSEEQARLLDLAAECERYAESVATGGKPLPLRVGRTELRARSALTPVIDEIERLVRELPAAEALVVNEPRATGGWWAADALSNRDYAHFAVKVTLAAMLCYVVYTAVDWDGIHTCMITCAVVALGSAGATVHKSALRLVGCVIGGGLALASIVFLVPHMTSIGSLALLVAAVTAPSAWIAMGSERTAYLGMQIAFTFYLVPRSVRRYRFRCGRDGNRVFARMARARRSTGSAIARRCIAPYGAGCQ
jgi:multidrug resistance protein MdtO